MKYQYVDTVTALIFGIRPDSFCTACDGMGCGAVLILAHILLWYAEDVSGVIRYSLIQ